MNYGRDEHTATLLNNGEVLLIGSSFVNSGRSIAELYNPSAGTFSITGTMSYPRYEHTATLLNNGKVLVAGTLLSNSGQSISELYDPSAGTFSTTGTMSYGRSVHTSVLLNNGKVLLTGASGGGGGSISELYTPSQDIEVSNDGSPTNGYGMPRPEKPDNGKGILGEQRSPVLAVDSSDNAIVAWEDTRFSAIQNWGLMFSFDANAYWQTTSNVASSEQWNGGGGSY